MNCYFCGAKISNSEIYRRIKMARQSQCLRFIHFLHCNKCNKCFNYRYLHKHKKLFNDTLILIQ